MGGCCTAPAAFGRRDNLCSQPLLAIFTTLLGAHRTSSSSRILSAPWGALGTSSGLESLSRGLGMEGWRGSGSTSKCSSLCLLLFQNIGRRCGVNSWPNPLFPGRLLERFAKSVKEVPPWQGAQGFRCHSYHFQQLPALCVVCRSAFLMPGN